MGVGNKGLEVFDEEETMNTGSRTILSYKKKGKQVYGNTQGTVAWRKCALDISSRSQNSVSQTNYACITLH